MNKGLTGYDAVYRRCTAAVPCCTTDLQLHRQNNIKHGHENRCLCRLRCLKRLDYAVCGETAMSFPASSDVFPVS